MIGLLAFALAVAAAVLGSNALHNCFPPAGIYVLSSKARALNAFAAGVCATLYGVLLLVGLS